MELGPLKNVQLRKKQIKTIQINLGNLCNQCCLHCHVEGSKQGQTMSFNTAKKIISYLQNYPGLEIEFTGGAPELAPTLELFLESLSPTHSLKVRTNLTALFTPQGQKFFELYPKYQVHLIASFPSLNPKETDTQRNKDTFNQSIQVLKKLNQLGYGKQLSLDLVYNPLGPQLPPQEEVLEKEYKDFLKINYNLTFHRLYALTNVPITRFATYLKEKNKLDAYLHLLKTNFSSENLDKLMCLYLLSVDREGFVYDCDFNQALKQKIKGLEKIKLWERDLNSFLQPITLLTHCLACTAGQGSSCQGSLQKNKKECVQSYYSSLSSKQDLKTSACCSFSNIPERVKKVLPLIALEVKERFYGCGSPIPEALEGQKILDLGCGTGRDAYILAKLVGEKGKVYGLDMTKAQVEVAKRYIEFHQKRFNYTNPNTYFIEDLIENMDKHFTPNSLDIIVSNCVLNLVENKKIVFEKIYKLLKEGGELYFSDIYADRRLPLEIKNNELLYAECLGGCLYVKDFERMVKKIGFLDPRVVEFRKIQIKEPEIKKLIGSTQFFSITYRLFKISELEEGWEDYGQIAIYNRPLEGEFVFKLDAKHHFELSKPTPVCGNTALILSKTRFNKYFKVIGDFSTHFGEFKDCAQPLDTTKEEIQCC